MGDLIHNLFAVKGLCEKYKTKANLYITNDLSYGGDTFTLDVENTLNDLFPLLSQQEYINNIEILQNKPQEAINLNEWRNSPFFYKTSWNHLLSSIYAIPIPSTPWLSTISNEKWKNRVVIHRSMTRHTSEFPWKEITEKNECVFITNNKEEYNRFSFKSELYLYSSLLELSIILNSCKFFIGNMSMPLSMARALNIPLLAELYPADEIMYIEDVKYYENFFYISPNSRFTLGMEDHEIL